MPKAGEFCEVEIVEARDYDLIGVPRRRPNSFSMNLHGCEVES
jgi:hypothetical protein